MAYSFEVQPGWAITHPRVGIKTVTIYQLRIYWKKKLCVRYDSRDTKAAADKAGKRLVASYTDYLRRNGKRYEVVQAEKRAEGKAAMARRNTIRIHAIDLHDAAKKALRLSRPSSDDLRDVMAEISTDIAGATEKARRQVMKRYS